MIDSTAEMFFQACGGHVPLRLAIVGENHETGYVSFERPFLLVGRSPECDLQLDDPEISFRHAYLQIVDGRVLCVDLASRTGINFRTGSKPMQWLDLEDPVQIGSHVIQLQRSDVLETPTHNSSIIISGAPADDDRKKLPKVAFELLNRPGMGIVSRQKYWPVRHQVSLIGWSPACKLQLKDSSVSRVHASVVLTSTGLWIVNLLGKGGTKVNDDGIKCTQLVDGDEVQIGRFRMRIHFDVSLASRALVQRPEVSPAPPRDEEQSAPKAVQDSGSPIAAEAHVLNDAQPFNTTPRKPRDRKPIAAESKTSRPATPSATDNEQRGLIRTNRDERGLKTQRELARRPKSLPTSAAPGLPEQFVNNVMDRFVQMQQQTFDHNLQMMTMVTQLFAKMHERQQDMIQSELARVREIDQELQSIRAAIVARSHRRDSIPALPDATPPTPAIEPINAPPLPPALDLPQTEVVDASAEAAAPEASAPPEGQDEPSIEAGEWEITVDDSDIPIEPYAASPRNGDATFDVEDAEKEATIAAAASEVDVGDTANHLLDVRQLAGDDVPAAPTHSLHERNEIGDFDDRREGDSAEFAAADTDDRQVVDDVGYSPAAASSAAKEFDDEGQEDPSHEVFDDHSLAEAEDGRSVRSRSRQQLEQGEYPDEFELERRLRMLEKERSSRWQRIMDFISGSIPMS